MPQILQSNIPQVLRFSSLKEIIRLSWRRPVWHIIYFYQEWEEMYAGSKALAWKETQND